MTILNFFKKIFKKSSLSNEDILKLYKNKEAVFIDVRNKHEIEKYGKLDLALHIPVSEVSTRIKEFQNFTKPILIYCKSGGRASIVVRKLKSKGISNSYNVGGFFKIKALLK